jgi:hypothetical protein
VSPLLSVLTGKVRAGASYLGSAGTSRARNKASNVSTMCPVQSVTYVPGLKGRCPCTSDGHPTGAGGGHHDSSLQGLAGVTSLRHCPEALAKFTCQRNSIGAPDN